MVVQITTARMETVCVLPEGLLLVALVADDGNNFEKNHLENMKSGLENRTKKSRKAFDGGE